MRNGFAIADVAFLFLAGATGIGDAFLFAGPRATSTPHRHHQHHQHDPHVAAPAAPAAVTTTAVVLLQARPRTTVAALRITPADSSTEQQPQSSPGPQAIGEEEGTSTSESQEGAAQSSPVPTKDSTRRGIAVDGTSLAFRPPTTEDLHKLAMGDWVAQRGMAGALVALDGTGQEAKAAGEAIVGAPLAGAVVESMDGVGGSSVATRVCLLRHRREDGVSEAVEHALLDETINQFLNDGARISQVACLYVCGCFSAFSGSIRVT